MPKPPGPTLTPEQPEFVRECIGWGAFATVIVPAVLLVTGSTVQAALISGAAVAAVTVTVYLVIRMGRMPLAAVEDPPPAAQEGSPDLEAESWGVPPPIQPPYSVDVSEEDVGLYGPAPWEAPAGPPYTSNPWEGHPAYTDGYDPAPWGAAPLGDVPYEPDPWETEAPPVSPYAQNPWAEQPTGAGPYDTAPWTASPNGVDPYDPYDPAAWPAPPNGVDPYDPAGWPAPPNGVGPADQAAWEAPPPGWLPDKNADDVRPPWDLGPGDHLGPARPRPPLPPPAERPNAYPPDQRKRHRRA